jgi:hypothetical protein
MSRPVATGRVDGTPGVGVPRLWDAKASVAEPGLVYATMEAHPGNTAKDRAGKGDYRGEQDGDHAARGDFVQADRGLRMPAMVTARLASTAQTQTATPCRAPLNRAIRPAT